MNEKSFGSLQILANNKLIVNSEKAIAIFSMEDGAMNFVFNETDNSFLSELISDRRVHSSEFVSFDPQKTWLEKKSIIGVTDDVGFDDLLELNKDWYYVVMWSAD